MNKEKNISQSSIYRNPSSDEKRNKEAAEILHLLLRLEGVLKLDDVQFGQEPPDFIFSHQGQQIGVELTNLDPKVFKEGGHKQTEEFRDWHKSVEANGTPHHFDKWETYSLRDSLAAFQNRLNIKRKKAERWGVHFQERWLLMNLADGGPFLDLIADNQEAEITTDLETDVAAYRAKAIHSIHSICQEMQPFDYVLLFRKTNLAKSVCNLLAFTANPTNPHNLPVATEAILIRGAAASDSFLDWKWRRERIITRSRSSRT